MQQHGLGATGLDIAGDGAGGDSLERANAEPRRGPLLAEGPA